MAQVQIPVATTTTKVVDENENRSYLLLVNVSDEPIYVMFGTDATTAGTRLNANGGSLEITAKEIASTYEGAHTGKFLYRRQVNAIHAGTGNKNINYTEV